MSNACIACLWIEQLGIAVERHRLPDTIDEPLALANPSGLIQVTSAEAERWGIIAGMTAQGARGLCSDLRLLPYDKLAYEIAARPIWDLIATESSIVEPVSPEICYAEVRGQQADVISRMNRLTEAMAPIMQLPVRSGIARSKFVSLRAAQHRSVIGPVVIPLGEEARFLAHTPLGTLLPQLPKLDNKSRLQLDRLGVKTLGDVWALSPQRLPKSLQRLGHQMLQLAQGFDNDPIRALWPPRTIVIQTMFTEENGDGGGYPDGVEDFFVVENRIVKMAERIAEKLAAKHEYTREITLRVGLRDGTFLDETERLAMPESQVPTLHRAIMRQLQRLQIEQPIVALEVIAAELGVGSGVQLSLMDTAGEMPHERAIRLEAAISFLRKRYGPRVIITGALLRKARRINLWTYSLTRYQSSPLEQVATDDKGNPVRYWRRNVSTARRRIQADQTTRQKYEVLKVHNRWRETGMRHGTLADAEVWRVETNPSGVSDVQKLDSQWRLTATFD